MLAGAQKAVGAAAEFITGVFPTARLHGLRLEEVFQNDSRDRWFVTYSFIDSEDEANAAARMLGVRPRRQYKVVEVDANDLIGRAVREKAEHP